MCYVSFYLFIDCCFVYCLGGRGARWSHLRRLRCAAGICEIHPISPTNIFPSKISWLELSGKSPLDMRIPPLIIKIMLESNPLKSIILVRRLAVNTHLDVACVFKVHGQAALAWGSLNQRTSKWWQCATSLRSSLPSLYSRLAMSCSDARYVHSNNNNNNNSIIIINNDNNNNNNSNMINRKTNSNY